MTVIACHKQLSPPSSFKPSEPSRLQTAGAIFLNLQMPEPAITPTYNGHIASTRDALIIIEACLTGRLNHIGRRPRESEEAILPSSGNIFVYESRSSGITSWQDGIQWSQAQRVGNLDLRLQSGSSATTSRTNGVWKFVISRSVPVRKYGKIADQLLQGRTTTPASYAGEP